MTDLIPPTYLKWVGPTKEELMIHLSRELLHVKGAKVYNMSKTLKTITVTWKSSEKISDIQTLQTNKGKRSKQSSKSTLTIQLKMIRLEWRDWIPLASFHSCTGVTNAMDGPLITVEMNWRMQKQKEIHIEQESSFWFRTVGEASNSNFFTITWTKAGVNLWTKTGEQWEIGTCRTMVFILQQYQWIEAPWPLWRWHKSWTVWKIYGKRQYATTDTKPACFSYINAPIQRCVGS